MSSGRIGFARTLWGVLLLLAVGGRPSPGAQSADFLQSTALVVRPTGAPGFSLLPASATGLAFTNTVAEGAVAANRVLEGGSGVAVGDFDKDGWPDLFFCSLEGNCRLYRNEGQWKFTDVTAGSGIRCSNWICRGAVFADLDGDGRLDLLISTSGAGVLCFMNAGGGRFTNETPRAGTASRSGSTTMALADVDGNGTLDLYVANYRTNDIKDQGRVDLHRLGGKLAIPPAYQNRLLLVNDKVQEYGEADLLYLNDGHGRFQAVSWTSGAFLDEGGKPLSSPPLDWGLGAAFRDLNEDGFPDLYVCNDYWTPDRIWINNGRGQFRALGRSELRHTSASSMGVDFADLDRDGHTDLLVVDMLSRDRANRLMQAPAYTPPPSRIGEIYDRPQVNRNTLFRGRGDGSFEEIADLAGLSASGWSWQPVFLDVDLDGFEDVLVAAGHLRDVQDRDANERLRTRRVPWVQTNGLVQFQGKRMPFQQAFTLKRMEDLRDYSLLQKPILAFRNGGNLKFTEVTQDWGLDVIGVHQGVATGDLDNDGDLDLVVNRLNAPAAVFRNQSSAPRVAVELRGRAPNTAGIGAVVRLQGGAVPGQSQEMMAGGKYLSGSQPRLMFATGTNQGGMTMEVTWRNGSVATISNVLPNTVYIVKEPEEPPRPRPIPPSVEPLFEDVSRLLGHGHFEEPFDDFAVQPGLSRRLSQAGPGVAWLDLDGDGYEDLVIGSGKGGRLGVYRNEGGKRLTPLNPPFLTPTPRDQLALLGWPGQDGRNSILVAASNYEDGQARGDAVLEYSLVSSNALARIPAGAFAVGGMALADMRGTGDMDLFVAGRPVRGRYPEGGGCGIYRRRPEGWVPDVENSRVFAGVKWPVNSAVWSDLDLDGYPELILACEWGPVCVYKNEGGRLRDATDEWGLAEYTGWWTGVNTADLDGDGQLEIMAANWGWNSPFQASRERPLILFYTDSGPNGVRGILETEYDPVRRSAAAWRPWNEVVLAFPHLHEQYATHQAFAQASAAEILGPFATAAVQLTATTLASTVFFHRGDRYVPVELPSAAQVAPAFGVAVADFDGDGHEDVFLSQNFFATYPWLPRLDAGRGLLLAGDGHGGLRPVGSDASGVRVDGEQRGAAACDFDHDGRVDLAVTQNGAATRLFRNRSGRAGLRVSLVGPSGHPSGIGATIRLKSGARFGPARTVHGGAGYLSQDGLTQVFALGESASEVWVRWPGGKTSSTRIPPGERTLAIRAP